MKAQLLKYLIALSFLIQFNAIGQLIIEVDSIYCPNDPISLKSKKGLGNFHWSSSNGNLIFNNPNSYSTTTEALYGNYEINLEADLYNGNIVEYSGFDDWIDNVSSDLSFETTYKLVNDENHYFSPGLFNIDTIITFPEFECPSSLNYYKKITPSGDTIPRGYFLLADGHSIDTNQSNNSDFAKNNYIWQISDVYTEENTLYTFSMDASILNIPNNNTSLMVLVNGIPIPLTIDGINKDTIVKINTNCDWKNVKGTWNSNNSKSTTLTIAEIRNYAQYSDFAIDNIAFYKSISQHSTSVSFKVMNDCSSKSLKDTTFCEKDKIITTLEEKTKIYASSNDVTIDYIAKNNRHIFSFEEIGQHNIDLQYKNYEDNLISDSYFNNWPNNSTDNLNSFNTTYQFNETVNTPSYFQVGSIVNDGYQTEFCTNESFQKTTNLFGDTLQRNNVLYAQAHFWSGSEQPRTTQYGINNYIWAQTFDVTKNTNYTISFDAASYSQNAAIMLFVNDTPIDIYVNKTNHGAIFDITTTCTWNKLINNWNSGNSTSVTLKIAEVSKTGYGIGIAIDNIVFYSNIIDEIKTTTINVEDCIITPLEDQYSDDIGFYPNPTSDFIYINTKNKHATNIYNNSGKLISTSNESIINIVDFPRGIYIIEIVSKSGTERHKLIKQ